MDQVIQFLASNYDWLFSGILSGLLFFVLGNKVGYYRAVKLKQKIGNNSRGIQVGGNLNVGGSLNASSKKDE